MGPACGPAIGGVVRREVGIWPHASVLPSRRPRAASRRPSGAPRSGNALGPLARGSSLDSGLARCVRALRPAVGFRQHRPVPCELERRSPRRVAALPLPRLRRHEEAQPRERAARRRARALSRERRRLRARHAFELAPREPLPYRVLRPEPAESGALHARIDSPDPCGERWDRFLARELACSRGSVRSAAERGALRLEGARDLARPVQDGQGFAWAR